MTTDQSSTYSLQEAFYGILSLALVAIGTEDLVDEDASRFNVVINRMELFKGLTTEMANNFTITLQPYLSTDWDVFLAKYGAVISSELRDTAFVLSCDLILRNGFIPHKADGYLELLQTALNIDNDFAAKSISVIKVKNRG